MLKGTHERPYVDLNDGTKVYGTTVDVVRGGNIVLDKVKYKLNEIKGVQMVKEDEYGPGTQEVYYLTSMNNMLYQTVFNGSRIGVFCYGTGYSSGHMSGTLLQYYYKKSDGNLVRFRKYTELAAALADCNKTKSLADLSEKEIKSELKDDYNFILKALEDYENKCK